MKGFAFPRLPMWAFLALFVAVIAGLIWMFGMFPGSLFSYSDCRNSGDNQCIIGSWYSTDALPTDIRLGTSLDIPNALPGDACTMQACLYPLPKGGGQGDLNSINCNWYRYNGIVDDGKSCIIDLGSVSGPAGYGLVRACPGCTYQKPSTNIVIELKPQSQVQQPVAETVTVTVVDSGTNVPISGSTVSASGQEVTTSSSGQAVISSGQPVTVTVSADGYSARSVTVTGSSAVVQLDKSSTNPLIAFFQWLNALIRSLFGL